MSGVRTIQDSSGGAWAKKSIPREHGIVIPNDRKLGSGEGPAH
jgi:hypothetical protein